MRHAARTDANHAAISDALRSIGARVYYVKWPCDVFVAYRGKWIAIEFKSLGGRLTLDQTKLIAETDAPVHVVETVEQAIAVVVAEGAVRGTPT